MEVNNKAVGSIRFDIQDNQIGKISYLVDPHFTGEGFGTYLLKSGVDKCPKKDLK